MYWLLSVQYLVYCSGKSLNGSRAFRLPESGIDGKMAFNQRKIQS